MMTFLPVLLLSFYFLPQCIHIAGENGASCDYFAFFKYSFGWLLPSIMVSTGMGYLITELTQNVLAILIQGVWWYTSLMTSFVGSIGLKLIPRFNELGATKRFLQIRNQLILNRLFYTALGVVLILLTILVFDYRRKGGLQKRGKI